MLPKHIGIIMDGNGRWAKAKNRSRNYGHQKGADALHDVIEAAYNRGVRCISFYALSTENWQRPKDEVDKLLSIMSKLIDTGLNQLIKMQAKLVISGDLSCLSPRRLKKVRDALKQTENFSGKIVNFCFNYGSRAEIVRAANECARTGKTVTEEEFSKLLYTADMPDVDLIIRTSGEQRLSNFLLWQSAYAELYFTPVMWPDFTPEELDKALTWFSERKRRFGKSE